MTGDAADLPRQASVILVSRHRPAQLLRCLRALDQQDHPDFEVVLVVDPATSAALPAELVGRVKVCVFDQANISAARNLGLALASAPIVAFVDDDAVPEPAWLAHLSQPFHNADVVAAGGFVRARNGISFQWRAGLVDATLQPRGLVVPDDTVTLHRSQPGLAVEVKGVNCAYRRDVLLKIGGFDPAIRYYLDETELNLRLAGRSPLVAVVPMAQVWHDKAPSPQRDAGLRMVSLLDVGRSLAITARRHGADAFAALARLTAEKLEKGGKNRRLEESLAQGFSEGMAADLPELRPIPPGDTGFLPFRTHAQPQPRRVLAGRIWQKRRLFARAAALAEQGNVVTVLLLSPTTRFHRSYFDYRGYWVQRGGLFGKAVRSEPLFRIVGFRHRIRQETSRIAPARAPFQRGLGHVTAEKPSV